MFSPLPDSPVSECPPFRVRLISAVLFVLFALVAYDTCNAIAGWRGTSRCLAFPWELDIPRINWFVLPYLTIDVLLALSPVFTRRYDEWRTLLRRLFWAFAISCAVFLMLPFRCAYPRSIPDDWTAPLFQLLHFTDLPFNQAPSLHISEAIIVAPVLLARLRHPLRRAALIVWLVLGSAGTVLTHQHHLLDVLTGAALGFAVVWRIPKK